MGKFTIWVDSQWDINQWKYFIENTILKKFDYELKRVYSNNNYDFVKNPKKIQELLYLDKPDVIITYKEDENSIYEPILCIEISEQTPMWQNTYQRFARATSSIELWVPFIFIFPEKDWVQRDNWWKSSWEKSSPFIFYALKKLSEIHNIPAFSVNWDISNNKIWPKWFKYYDEKYINMPSSKRNNIKKIFLLIDNIVSIITEKWISGINNIKNQIQVITDLQEESNSKAYSKWYDYLKNIPSKWSWEIINTNEFKKYIFNKKLKFNEELPENILNRKESLIFLSKTKTFRADPYTWSILVYDYCFCRFWKLKENRHKNLIIHLPEVSFLELEKKYKYYYDTKCPLKWSCFSKKDDIQYLTLHLREWCKFTKQKEFRIFFYFADMIILKDKILY